MIFSLGTDLTFQRHLKTDFQAEPQPAAFAIAELPRDRLVYDVNGVTQDAFASVPVSGTVPSGEQVEARIICESGKEIVPWTAMQNTSGTFWSGFLPCPLRWGWMKLQARRVSQPDEIHETTNRLGAGHVLAIWGGDQASQYWNSGSSLGPEAALEILDCVHELKTNRGTNGCQWNDPFKTPDTDALPAGAEVTGKVLDITEDLAFEGWDFTGYLLTVRAKITLRNCILGERDGPTGHVAAIDIYPEGAYDLIEYCDFIGPSGEGGYGLFLKIRTGGNASVDMPVFRRNRLWGFGSDAIKPNKGLIEWNYVDAPVNLNEVPVPFDPNAEYPAGILVRSDQKHIWRAKQSVSGVAPPITKSGASEYWENLDPHADLITVPETSGPVIIRANYLNRDVLNRAHPAPGRGVTGMNNAIRMVRNNSGPSSTRPYGQVTVEYCVIPGDLEGISYPLQASSGTSGAPYTDPEIRHCKIMPRRNNRVMHPTTGGSAPIWTDNEDFEGTQIALPPNTVEGSSIRARGGDAVQHVWHDRMAPGAGGVQARTTDEIADAALAALSNTLASSRPGERFCVIHHTSAQADLSTLATGETSARAWEDELALQHVAVGNGASIKLAVSDWPFQSRVVEEGQSDLLASFYSGRLPNGAPAVLPATITDSNTGAVHILRNLARDIYGEVAPRWKAAATSTPGLVQNLASGARFEGGASDPAASATEAARVFARAHIRTDGLDDVFAPETAEFLGLATQSGFPSDTGDGIPRHARIMGTALASGMSSVRVMPVFDRCIWDPSGAFVEIWWSKGAITTTRLARQKPSLGATFAHWTQVIGFEINAEPAQNAQIVNGRVRLFPNSAQFNGGDVIQYGAGRGTGLLKSPEDETAELWQDLPIANLGTYGLEGVAVQPLPDPEVLRNTLGS